MKILCEASLETFGVQIPYGAIIVLEPDEELSIQRSRDDIWGNMPGVRAFAIHNTQKADGTK